MQIDATGILDAIPAAKPYSGPRKPRTTDYTVGRSLFHDAFQRQLTALRAKHARMAATLPEGEGLPFECARAEFDAWLGMRGRPDGGPLAFPMAGEVGA